MGSTSLPQLLIDSLQDCEGFNCEAFLRVHEEPLPVTSIRINPAKCSVEHLQEHFRQMGCILEPIPWTKTGYYLSSRPVFTADPLFHAGCYYVQESSSMFLEWAMQSLLPDTSGLKVLDLCAAPGGKSTLIQQFLGNNGLLVSNEVIRSRAGVLEENLVKWGGAAVVVTQNDPSDFQRLPGFFDVLVVDAPCSGSGLFRRDPDAVVEWSSSSVELCCQRQQRILSDVLPALKQDGYLFYSTCSYSEQENEAISIWLQDEMEMERIDVDVNPNWNLVEGKGQGKGIRFWPDRVKGEGFYLACFKKKGTNSAAPKPVKKIVLEKLSKSKSKILESWVSKEIQELAAYETGENLFLFPECMLQDLKTIMAQNFYIRVAGIRLGRWAGEELIPEHALAISEVLHPQVQRYSLNKETALNYLRREEIQLDQTNVHSATKHLWSIASFSGQPLGWMKVLKNRVNNYYPKEWRILKRSFD